MSEGFDGFIKVDAPGIYLIWFGPDQDGSLAIGGKVFVHERKQTATAVPCVFDVPLLAGLHAIAITHTVRGSRPREGDAEARVRVGRPWGRAGNGAGVGLLPRPVRRGGRTAGPMS